MLTEKVSRSRAATRTGSGKTGRRPGLQPKPEPQLRNLRVSAHSVNRYRSGTDTLRTRSGYRRRFPAALVLVYAIFTACVVALIGLFCAGLWLVAP